MQNTYYLSIDRDIARWDEGIPLGNGETGCLFYGNAENLILSLDRGDLWERSYRPEDTEDFCYKTFVELAKTKNYKKIAQIFDKPYRNPAPTKLPVGKIVFHLGKKKTKSFSLDMKRAEACFFGEKGLYFKTFLHYVNGIGRIITNSKSADFCILNPAFGRKRKQNPFFMKKGGKNRISNRLKDLKYPDALFGEIDEKGTKGKYFVQEIADGSCFGMAVCEVNFENGKEFLYCTCLGKECKVLIDDMKKKIADASLYRYDEAIEEHNAIWNRYFSLSEISIDDKELERNYNMTNYLLGSGSKKGKYPMPLQGLWTKNDGKTLPPWKGDYHHDLNTELTYSSYLKANRLEAGLSFIEYLQALMPRAEEFAKKFYSKEGICLPSVMDIDGYALGGWPMYSLSPTNQLWLCQSFERHFSYTGDIVFLKETAYPYIERSAKFIASMLHKDEQEFYGLPLSSSPEIFDNSAASYLVPNSNYDQSLILYIFQTVIRLGKILGKDPSFWEEYLFALRPLAVNEEGVLMLDCKKTLHESHRHLSHLMSIYPLRLFDYNNSIDRKLIDSSICYTEKLGSKYYTGYTFAWLACLETVRKNGDSAYRYLDIFRKYFCSVNGFHLNGDYQKKGYSSLTYRPFSLEGNFCAASAIQEMLLYSENGITEIFPAVPSHWKNVSFQSLRGYGGILVSASIKNGLIDSVKFEAENDCTIHLRGDFEDFISDSAVKKYDDGYSITIQAGQTILLKRKAV